MPLNWSDERYVRLYTRDTPQWQCLSFLAQGLFCLLLRKVDRAGVLPLGRMGRKAVFVSVGHAHQAAMLDPALDELLVDGCIEIRGDDLVVPNFIEAQEAEASDKARARASRERRRAGVTGKRHEQNHVTQTSQNVTGESRVVTECHENTTLGNSCDANVTPSRAVPSVPSKPSVPCPPAGERACGSGRAGLGILGSELVRYVEGGLGHGLIPLDSEDKAASLETAIARHGGVEAAQGFIAATVRRRDTDPQSVAWLLTVLEKAPEAARA